MKTTPENLFGILARVGVLSTDQVKELAQRWSAHLRLKSPRRRADERPAATVDERHEPDLLDFIVGQRLRSAKDARRLIGERDLYEGLALGLGLPFQRIDPLRLDMDLVTRTIPRPFAVRHLMVPLTLEDEVLTLATADPFNDEGLENIQRSTGYTVHPVVAVKSDIVKIITEFYGFKSSVVKAEKGMAPAVGALSSLEQYVRLKSVKEMEATDHHIVNAVDFLFTYAFDQRASDIHFEPRRERARIRFRIDGLLHTIHQVPNVIHPAMVSRIKMLSRLDIAERRRPQDGRIKVAHKGRDFEIRVSTLPTAFGEKIVMRIFDPEILLQDISQLGFAPEQLQVYQRLASSPHGIILVTGPTGSGKTTTLYSTLAVLATEERNVTTVEDPIEMIHEDFNQVGVQPQVGLTFATTLRHILRQDPDIIMVGEIRDAETAENAIQAALTGHLVLSTLHTNDAPTAITRLADMGIPRYLIGSTILLVAAQRLVRRICPHCSEEYEPSPEELASLGLRAGVRPVRLRRGTGCAQCRFTGHHGRTGLFELMPVTPGLRALIHGGADQGAIQILARKEGMRTLRESGVQKVIRGVTTLAEVLRVTMGDVA
ncbi:MAG: GspE/PulE family protein [Candidatus Methylomirabilia bacterium]